MTDKKRNLDLPITGSPSRTETSLRCHRRHMVQDNLCMRPTDRRDNALNFGTVIHAGAAPWWAVGSEKRAMTIMKEEAKLFPDMDSDGKHTVELAEGLLWYYMANAKLAGGHWGEDYKGWKPIAIEDRVILDLTNCRLSFKLDRLVVNDTFDPPEAVLVDLKTARGLGSYWSRQFPLSMQQKLYRAAVRQEYNLEPTHFIEGLLKKLPTDIEYVLLPDWSTSELDEAVEMFERQCAKDAGVIERARLPDGEIDMDFLFEYVLTKTDYNPFDCYSYGVPCPLLKTCTQPFDKRLAIFKEEFEYVEPEYLD